MRIPTWTVTAVVDATGLSTDDVDRDAHIRSADFLEVDTYPTIELRSTGLRAKGTTPTRSTGISPSTGRTRPVTVEVELNGFTKDPFGGYRAGFSASAERSRADFGISMNLPMEGGRVVVGDKGQIRLEVEAVLDVPAA